MTVSGPKSKPCPWPGRAGAGDQRAGTAAGDAGGAADNAERGSGRILNISSPADGRFAPTSGEVYSASSAPWRCSARAIRFEGRTLRRAGDDHQPGTIGTDMTEREQKFELPGTPLWSSSMPNDSHATVSGEPPRPSRSPARSPTWSTVAACRCASSRAAHRTAVRPAHPKPAGQARPVAIQVVTPAPHQIPAPRRRTITTYGCRRRQRTVNPLIVPARYNFLYSPQGRPCGRPPAALRPGNDTTTTRAPASPSLPGGAGEQSRTCHAGHAGAAAWQLGRSIRGLATCCGC